jgi:hypothetical protein
MELLATWATHSDRPGEGWRDPDDALAEVAETDAASREALERAQARERRRRELVGLVRGALIDAGLVPKRLRAMVVGYRAVRDERGPRAVLVTDPHPDDKSVFRGPRARELAQAAAESLDACEHVTLARADRRYPHLAAELVPRWYAGEFPSLAEFDAEVRARLEEARGQDTSLRWAQLVRSSWAIRGTMGGSRTTPPATAPEIAQVADRRTDL